MKERNSSLLERPSFEVIDLDNMAAARKSPGIVVVNRQDEIAYVNRSAWDMLGLLREQGTVPGDALMPTAILEICRDVSAKCRKNSVDSSPPNSDAIRLVITPSGHVLLRAVMMESGIHTFPHAKSVLVLLEHVVTRSQASAELKERFGLTDREWAVAQILMKGYTNKEIAQALDISEPTVKSHLNHIMQKVNCSTRTAVVSLMMGSAS